jgi:hypothetical protein
MRRYIEWHRAGRAKQLRWAICLHEAGHAAAFAWLCGRKSSSFVYRWGGICRVSPSPHAGPLAESMCVLAGDLAASMAPTFPELCGRIPAGRPRRRRMKWTRHRALKPDGEQYASIKQENAAVLEHVPGLALQWEQGAMNFVCCRRMEIVRIAERLYCNGHVFTPAHPPGGDWILAPDE